MQDNVLQTSPTNATQHLSTSRTYRMRCRTLVVVCLLLTRSCMAVWPWRMFIVSGVTFTSTTGDLALNLTSACKCKMTCVTVPWCSAWTAVKKEDREFQCFLTKRTALDDDAQLLNKTNAVYGYKLAKLAHDGMMREDDDGTVFFVTQQMGEQKNGTWSPCPRVPGFRLAILRKMKQFQVATNITWNQWIRIDLDGSNGERRWGDNTMFPVDFEEYVDESRDSGQYCLNEGLFKGGDLGGNYRYLCQGNDGDTVW